MANNPHGQFTGLAGRVRGPENSEDTQEWPEHRKGRIGGGTQAADKAENVESVIVGRIGANLIAEKKMPDFGLHEPTQHAEGEKSARKVSRPAECVKSTAVEGDFRVPEAPGR
jgi:hypothetical protein